MAVVLPHLPGKVGGKARSHVLAAGSDWIKSHSLATGVPAPVHRFGLWLWRTTSPAHFQRTTGPGNKQRHSKLARIAATGVVTSMLLLENKRCTGLAVARGYSARALAWQVSVPLLSAFSIQTLRHPWSPPRQGSPSTPFAGPAWSARLPASTWHAALRTVITPQGIDTMRSETLSWLQKAVCRPSLVHVTGVVSLDRPLSFSSTRPHGARER